MAKRPRLAVFKFASCDGCQLTLLSAEDQLIGLSESIDIAYFLEATSRNEPGPYDIALIEGSISTPADLERIQQVRRDSKYVVAIGACATAGGIQALRNYAHHEQYVSQVYAHSDYIESLATATPVAQHIEVDFELRGCPIDKSQLVEVLKSLLHGRLPRTPAHSVCLECKRKAVVCRAVVSAEPCLGAITQAGCGDLCPSFSRPCFGCYGPNHQANVTAWVESSVQPPNTLVPLLRSYCSESKGFGEAVKILDSRSES